MASIERTVYPRFRHEPNARELQDLFTPVQEELDFARVLVRSSDEHFFAAVLLLKCLQYLGYFPELTEIPKAIVNHVRICLRLPFNALPVYDQTRTMRRHQTAIREHLKLRPRHSREARKVAVRAVFDAAQVVVNPADLINVAVEQLRSEQCELPTFSTLDRMVNRVRAVLGYRDHAAEATPVFVGQRGRLTPRGFDVAERMRCGVLEVGGFHVT
jgi:hypothetical protein